MPMGPFTKLKLARWTVTISWLASMPLLFWYESTGMVLLCWAACWGGYRYIYDNRWLPSDARRNWSLLSARFGARRKAPGTTIVHQGCMVLDQGRGRLALGADVGCSARCLYLNPYLLGRLEIPWDHFESVQRTKFPLESEWTIGLAFKIPELEDYLVISWDSAQNDHIPRSIGVR